MKDEEEGEEEWEKKEEEEGFQEVELEKPAVEAGHPAGRAAHGSRHTAGEGEGGGWVGGTGNGDQFCQNWVHTPGAAELGWPAERETEEGRELEGGRVRGGRL